MRTLLWIVVPAIASAYLGYWLIESLRRLVRHWMVRRQIRIDEAYARRLQAIAGTEFKRTK